MPDSPRRAQEEPPPINPIEEARIHGRVVNIDLWYPRCEHNCNTVEIGLVDVRAADSLRISFDFHRDGWSIQQAAVFKWNSVEEADAENAQDWQEVTFVEAWARERKT